MLTYQKSYDGGTFEDSTLSPEMLASVNAIKRRHILKGQIPDNWPVDAPDYHPLQGWKFQVGEVSKAYKRYFEKLAEIERMPTMPYYSIFGSQAELKADLDKAQTIALRIYDRILHKFN